jgi:predicted CopG family antitoxin
MSHTTISVSPEIRDRVKARKRGGEPYDAVIERLLEGDSAK